MAKELQLFQGKYHQLLTYFDFMGVAPKPEQHFNFLKAVTCLAIQFNSVSMTMSMPLSRWRSFCCRSPGGNAIALTHGIWNAIALIHGMWNAIALIHGMLMTVVQESWGNATALSMLIRDVQKCWGTVRALPYSTLVMVLQVCWGNAIALSYSVLIIIVQERWGNATALTYMYCMLRVFA